MKPITVIVCGLLGSLTCMSSDIRPLPNSTLVEMSIPLWKFHFGSSEIKSDFRTEVREVGSFVLVDIIPAYDSFEKAGTVVWIKEPLTFVMLAIGGFIKEDRLKAQEKAVAKYKKAAEEFQRSFTKVIYP